MKYEKEKEMFLNKASVVMNEETLCSDINSCKEVFEKIPHGQLEKIFIALNETGKNMQWAVHDYSDKLAKAVMAIDKVLTENKFVEITYEQKKAIDDLLSDYNRWSYLIAPMFRKILIEIENDIVVDFFNLTAEETAMALQKKDITLKAIKEYMNNGIDSEVEKLTLGIKKVLM